MPTVLNMSIDGTRMVDVIGSAYLPRKSVRVTEALDGSSLNVSSAGHRVTFTVPRHMLVWVKPRLALNSNVRFSAKYSTGETIQDASVLVTTVNYMGNGDIEYTLSVNPREAILHESAPG